MNWYIFNCLLDMFQSGRVYCGGKYYHQYDVLLFLVVINIKIDIYIYIHIRMHLFIYICVSQFFDCGFLSYISADRTHLDLLREHR